MPLIKAPSAAPSRRPYAIDPATFDGRAVQAIWLGRKNGATTISIGTLRFWWQPGMPDEPTLEECIANCDPRYGGDCRARWDGKHLWVNPSFPLDPAAQVARAEQLAAALATAPDIPAGFTGWFHLVEKGQP